MSESECVQSFHNKETGVSVEVVTSGGSERDQINTHERVVDAVAKELAQETE